MPEHKTFFQPTAVITTDLETGEKKLEIDWFKCQMLPDEPTESDLKHDKEAIQFLDQAIFSTAFWDPIHVDDDNSIIVEVHSLDIV